MEAFQKMILDIWREACRHLEISRTLPRIADLLSKHIPVRQLMIVRLDADSRELIPVAAGFLDQPGIVNPSVCTRDEAAALSQWRQTHTIRRLKSQSGDLVWLNKKLGVSHDMDLVIAPLGSISNPDVMLLMLSGRAGGLSESRHHDMIEALIEPLTLALENDIRFREMVQLREAAEADNKSLLVKLSRKSMEDTIIGAEQGLKTVMERVNLISASGVPVLIFGETGTGKELVSRLIHQKSDRAGGPFIRVNCGAIPPELIDAQLFGHERGAFTGAIETRQGWFERADGGTLFLDEVGEMPLEAQVRLLRILQDGWMERVGGKNAIRVDVRIVLATHRDLSAMVASGRFREDLWYRIATFPIFIPPLRDRPQDIRELANHFTERSATRFGLSMILPDDEQIALLAAYPWPGNIRELASVIDRASLLGNGETLEIRKALGWWEDAGPDNAKGQTTLSRTQEVLMPLDEAIKSHIQQALTVCKGRVEGKDGAAALLRINPYTLRGKMRKLGIDWADYRP